MNREYLMQVKKKKEKENFSPLFSMIEKEQGKKK
jgi:hypothetical protein